MIPNSQRKIVSEVLEGPSQPWFREEAQSTILTICVGEWTENVFKCLTATRASLIWQL